MSSHNCPFEFGEHMTHKNSFMFPPDSHGVNETSPCAFKFVSGPDTVSCLIQGLKHLGMSSGDSLLIPSFIGRKVYETLKNQGFNLNRYHINHHLRAAFNPRQLPPSNAVIVINYFGLPQPLGLFKAYCHLHQSKLIEDHSQGLFDVRDNKIRPGLRGDLGLIRYPSVDPHKYCKAFTLPLKPEPATDSSSPQGKELLQDIKFLNTKASKPEVCDHQADQRRQLFRSSYKIASKTPALIPWVHPPEDSCPSGFPFFSSDAVFETIQKAAHAKGLRCQSWPELPPDILSGCRSFYRTCRLIKF